MGVALSEGEMSPDALGMVQTGMAKEYFKGLAGHVEVLKITHCGLHTTSTLEISSQR